MLLILRTITTPCPNDIRILSTISMTLFPSLHAKYGVRLALKPLFCFMNHARILPSLSADY